MMDEQYLEDLNSTTFSNNNSWEDTTLQPEDPISIVHNHALPLAFIYITLLLLGILGNLTTCTVITRNKFMRTPTNYYLFSLAVSDMLIVIINVPFQVTRLWNQSLNLPSCIVYGVSAGTASNASILTTTAFTVERYLAICHPFNKHTMSDLSGVVKYVSGIWVVAFLLAVPPSGNCLFYIHPEYKENDFFKFIPYIFGISAFLFFVAPMALITVLYVLIGVALKRRGKEKGLGTHLSSEARVVKMLVAVVIVFFVCWSPFQAQRLLVVFRVLSNEAYINLTMIGNVMYFVSTTVNPVLYNIMSKKFRKAFKITFGRIRKKHLSCIKIFQAHNSPPEVSTSTSSTATTDSKIQTQKFPMVPIVKTIIQNSSI